MKKFSKSGYLRRDEIVRLVHDFMGEGTSGAPIFNLTDEILAELEKRGLIAELKEQP